MSGLRDAIYNAGDARYCLRLTRWWRIPERVHYWSEARRWEREAVRLGLEAARHG